jgi:hypothetical protein
MSKRVCRIVVAALAIIGVPLLIEAEAGAEHCWKYVDGVDYLLSNIQGQKVVAFPGFEFTKAPFRCIQQNGNPGCAWAPGTPCTVGGTCCTSIPDPARQEHILEMHSEWHSCFGRTGGTDPFAGRSARWLAFHRQFEFDFDLMREAKLGCGPGKCVMGTCSNNSNITCTTDVECDAHEGCFIESLDWRQNMVFPYGHFGANYNGKCIPSAPNSPTGTCNNNNKPCTVADPSPCVFLHGDNSACGTGPNRPDGVTCTECQALPACLFNAGAGPLNGTPATPSTNANCLGFEGSTLNQLPTLEVVAQILDSSHHANFHTEVASPINVACATDADCQTAATAPDPRCNPQTGEFCPTLEACDPVTKKFCPICSSAGKCVYNQDVADSGCSPRDPMFWRLHKRLDDTVRAWQETHPFDLSIVIDRSGSMGDTDSSGAKKIEVAAEAMKMLADLLPNAQQNRVGVVSYSTDVTADTTQLVSGANAPATIGPIADNLKNRVGGCTSIGGGLEGGIAQICTGVVTQPANSPSLGKKSCNPNDNPTTQSGENERKGILLLTDGLENREPCLNAASANATPVCGDTCGGKKFDFSLLGANTQVCAIGFGQGQSVNGNLLTLLAERQGGIYMQSPAKGPNDQEGANGQGRWVDLKDFFVKCFAQLSTEFVGIDPKGTLPADEFATVPVNYGTCDDERLTFVGGWNKPTPDMRLMVNAPSGALVLPGDPAVESSLKDTWNFARVPLPFHGELAGTWRTQLIRPHHSYVNGFTTDSLPIDDAVPMVRTQIQRICPTAGCATVLYFEDGHLGPRSSYEEALQAEQTAGLIGSLTRATDASDFDSKLAAGPWSLVVYAHQLTDGPEPYDNTLLNHICVQNQPIIITDTRVGDLSSIPGPSDPHFAGFRMNSCAGGTPFGELNFTQIVGDGRLLSGSHTLTNNGYAVLSYGQSPGTFGGATQALAFSTTGVTLGAISALAASSCSGEICPVVPSQDWFIDVLVRGMSQLDDAPTRFTYRTGESGVLASARVLPANIPAGGYDVSDVQVEIERPTTGVGRTLLNVGPQPPGATSSADGAAGRSAALRATIPIPTVKQTFGMNDDGIDGDLLAHNGYWTRLIPDSDTPGQCLVDGMYKMHFTARFTKNGCTTRRELVRSTFVDVGVDPRVSNLAVTPIAGGMSVHICPQDRCGNPSGWGRQITCSPTPGCTCAPSDIVDHQNGCYDITVHADPTVATCTIDGTGKPIDVKLPVTANAGPDQVLECAGGGATAQLDGSASSSGDGTPVAFLWSAPGITFSSPTIARPTARFPVGTTTVTLRVTAASGATATDTMLVTVVDTKPPVLTVPPDIIISACVNPNIGTATAVDGCGGTVTLTNNKPSRFPLGTTVVTYFAVDRFGNATSATQRVRAVLGDSTSCCPAGTTIRLGTSNNDTINGTAGSDCILGLGGQDTINGLGGNDFISGGEGDDIIDGGSGNDQLFGGNGQDTLRGNIGNDFLDGGGGDDHCFGGDNDDVILGGQGQDQLFGENGNDQLFGEDGDDHLEGGAGNDALDGGGLHDVCIGGPGTDTFNLCMTVQQ